MFRKITVRKLEAQTRNVGFLQNVLTPLKYASPPSPKSLF
jgi:hypothetical protein